MSGEAFGAQEQREVKRLSEEEAAEWNAALPELQSMALFLVALVKRIREMQEELPNCNGSAVLCAAESMMATAAGILENDPHSVLRGAFMAVAGLFPEEEVLGEEEKFLAAEKLMADVREGGTVDWEEKREIYFRLAQAAFNRFEERSREIAQGLPLPGNPGLN